MFQKRPSLWGYCQPVVLVPAGVSGQFTAEPRICSPAVLCMFWESSRCSHSPYWELKAPCSKRALQMWLSLSPGKSKAVWSHLEDIHSTLQTIMTSDLIFHNDPRLVSSQNSNWISEIIPSLCLWLRGESTRAAGIQPIMLILYVEHLLMSAGPSISCCLAMYSHHPLQC